MCAPRLSHHAHRFGIDDVEHPTQQDAHREVCLTFQIFCVVSNVFRAVVFCIRDLPPPDP
jgi:hypothetical protein